MFYKFGLVCFYSFWSQLYLEVSSVSSSMPNLVTSPLLQERIYRHEDFIWNLSACSVARWRTRARARVVLETSECRMFLFACRERDRPLAFAYARSVWYTLMDRLQNDPRCTLALNLLWARSLLSHRAITRAASRDNANFWDAGDDEISREKHVAPRILLLRILWTTALTSSARRDIAEAKNMQITMPANVRYLGPISSRAAMKFTVHEYHFKSQFQYFYSLSLTIIDWGRKRLSSLLSVFSLSYSRILNFRVYFHREFESVAKPIIYVRATYPVWKVSGKWQEKRDHSQSSAPCKSRSSDWSSWRWRISPRGTG